MATIFCDPSATGSNNGTSWTDAYTSFQTAYNSGGASDEIWIKARTIILSATISINNSDEPTVYGGFDIALTGTSGSVAGRTAGARTTFSGNSSRRCMTIQVGNTLDSIKLINGNDGTVGGLYVTASSSDNVVLRKFEIWDCTSNGGSAAGCLAYNFNTLLLDQCVFDGNVLSGSGTYGGAIAYFSSGNLTITDSVFNENTAELDAGGIYSQNSGTITCTGSTFTLNGTSSTGASYTDGGCLYSYGGGIMTFTDCKFDGNYTLATGSGGVAFSWDGEDITFINCTLTNNEAEYGGCFSNYSSGNVYCVNCTVADNEARDSGGGGVSSEFGPTFTNCIIWGNYDDLGTDNFETTATVTYSDVEGGYTGTGNVNDNPNFKAAGDDPYDLASASAAVDSGNAGATNYPSTDILGRARVDDPDTTNTGAGTPAYSDMGAYEMQVAVAAFVGSLLLLNN